MGEPCKLMTVSEERASCSGRGAINVSALKLNVGQIGGFIFLLTND